jgi:alpha-2-macroglobulin
MKPKISIILAVIIILLSTIFCSVFQSEPEIVEAPAEADSADIDQPAATLTPTTTPTPIPTNLVKLEDDGDPFPPQVIYSIPAGGQEIGASGTIQFQFDQAMEQNATSAAFSLQSPVGVAVPGEVTWPAADTLVFTPAEPLTPEVEYQASLSTAAVSTKSLALNDLFSLNISVASDLIITQVFPADGTLEVENNAVITVIFNRPVVALMTVEDQANLPHPVQFSPEIAGQGEWLNTSVYVYHPSEPLQSATTYTAQVAAGLTDTIGSQLSVPYRWQFTSAAPTISSFGIKTPISVLNPENNHENVRLESSFMINFRQPMDRVSVQEAVSLYSLNGENVAIDLEWTAETHLIISPTLNLDLNTDYTLMLTPNARAATGGTLAEGLRWTFRTLPYPAVESVFPADGTTQGRFSSRFGVDFNTPINMDTLAGRVDVFPDLDQELSSYYNPSGWSADFWGLEPSTDYTIRIKPGVEDLYGNPITEQYKFRFRTADRDQAAHLDMPYAPAIYRRGGSMKFYLSYVNVETVTVNLYQLPTDVFAAFSAGVQTSELYSRWDFVPPEDWWVNGWLRTNTKGINDISRVSFNLEDQSGDALAPGFYFMTLDSPNVEFSGNYLDTRLLVVSDANVTFKSTQTEGLMWVTDLDTGTPLADVSLGVYDSYFKLIGQGATNSSGLLKLDLPQPERSYDIRYVMTAADEPLGFALSDWGSGVSPYDFGIWSGYYVSPNQPVVYVYTDRPLYRPGQPVYFKGILRQNDDLNYSLLPWEMVEVEIQSYNETVYKEMLPLSEFGSFEGEITLDDEAALGYYSILVRNPHLEDGIGGVGFSVAEYRKPEFQVMTSATPENVLAGDEFLARVDTEYFSGGNVAGADVIWALYAVDHYFRPGSELSRYSFTDNDRDIDFYYDFYRPNSSENIASGTGQTDAQGSFETTLVADLSDTKASRKFTLETRVIDLAGTTVTDQTEIIAHQAAVYPGVRAARYVGKVGTEQYFDLVVVDWDSVSIPGATVAVEIVERRWHSVQKLDPQGFVTWESTVEEIPVTTFTDLPMNAQGKATVSFTPESGGVYKAKVTARDEFGNEAQAGAYMWVSGSDYVAWRQTDDRRIELVIDQDEYQPGDVAEILIAAPFQGDNYALVTVERGHIRTEEVLRLATNSAVYRLPITADMAPNIYVSVLVIQGADQGGKPDFRMGMVELQVNTADQNINIAITPDKEQAGPGDQVTYAIRTTDNSGNPVSAEVSLALADLATLTLSEPNSTPILDYFYAQRSLSVRTAVPIVLSIEHYISTLEDRLTEGEGMGSGGGKGADDFGVFAVRGDFRDTAYWEAQVVTNQNGEAQVTVTLPDNLTTWRMDARAVTTETLVGDAENDLRSTKPLLIRPQTPRFFVIEDQSVIGAAIHNNSNDALTVNVELQAEGLTLESPASQVVEIAAGAQAYITWDVTVNSEIERVDLVFLAQGGAYSDATKPTMGTLDDQGIPVYKYEAPETIGTAGMLMAAGSRTEGIIIPAEWQVTRGTLNVAVAPSLAAGMTAGLDYLEHYPYECTEQTISRFLPNVLTTQALQSAGIADLDLSQNLKDQVNIALQRVYNQQRPDGGWGWWPESENSDPLTSAYVVLGLVEAQAAGYRVSVEPLDRGLNYLKSQLQSLGNLDQQYLLNRQAFLLYVLARASQPQVSLTVGIYDLRQSLSLYARAYLAEALWEIDATDPRLDTLRSDFYNAAVMSATGTHWEEDWRDYWNWNTDTRTTAIVLAALLRIDPDNELNANAVRWLMTNRTAGHWQTTQETAWSLMTLTRWMGITAELDADYDWAVGLNGTRLGDGSATAENLTEIHHMETNVLDIFMDEVNRLTIAKDDGSGTLYYTAHLEVYLPVDQIQPLDRGIIITRDYFDPITSDPVTQAKQGDLLLARLTIVVPKALHYVVVNDPLPAGLEAVDQSLKTNPNITAPARYDYETIWQGGWGWWYFDHVELRDERVVISADYLPAGTYVYTYIVRASTPGTYQVIPPTAQEFYFPEVYGRGAGSQFIVKK